MPKLIPISGIIANFEFENETNVTPSSLRESLEGAGGEDILVTINSPGGSVFAGLEMFSLLQNYSGNVETRIVSLAASMGSVLALAGNEKSAENTAMYFVHNAQGIGIGDYRDLASESEWLQDISELIANLYAEYTNISLAEAREFMDDDTHFFGADLELLGFKIVNVGSEPNEPAARVNAKMKFSEVRAKMADEKYSDDLEKAAATIDYKKFGIENGKEIPSAKNEVATPASAGKNNKEATMDLSTFLAENPAAKADYDKAIADAKKSGAEAVQKRVEAASKYLTAENKYPESITNLAVKVINGETDENALHAAVAAVDAVIESKKSDDAAGETADQGETPADSRAAGSPDGKIETPEDMAAATAAAKKELGISDNGGN